MSRWRSVGTAIVTASTVRLTPDATPEASTDPMPMRSCASNTQALFDAHDLIGMGFVDASGVASGVSRTVDAVTIAVPTELPSRHRDAVSRRPAFRCSSRNRWRGSLAEADELIAAAAKSGAALAVGHTERFNPAVDAARPLLADPRFIEVHRLGTFPDRSLDIDVVFDLMIHDLDVVLSLVKADVESIEAVGVPVLTGRVDIANARLRFANGCIANLTASRISRDRVRKIRFFQPAAYLSIDYAAQKIELWRLVKGAGPMPSIEGGEVAGRQRRAAETRARGLRRRGRVEARAARRPAIRAGARWNWRSGSPIRMDD